MKYLAAFALTVCATAAAQEAAQFRLDGLSEKHFNPTRTEFIARVEGATIADTPGAVTVLINGQQLDERRIKVRDKAVIIDHTFADGVNDVLILASSDDESTLRGDALIWAGDNTLVVDVVDAKLVPVDGVEVRVALASNTAVSVLARTASGTARFDNLPTAALLVSAGSKAGRSVSSATRGDAGSLLLTLAEGD